MGNSHNQTEELFDAKFLGRLRSLFFKLRKRRQLQRRGQHSTPAAGFTREFKDHRSYTPGDDFRTIDWRLFARLEKPFIRIFEEVQEFHVHILIDRSGSMVDPYPQKRTMALRVTVALAYLALLSQHRVSILSLADELRRETQPMKGQGHVHFLLKQMAELEFGGTTDLIGSLRQFRPGRDRRGMVFLISDLFGRSPETSTEALLQATGWPAETHVIHVLHPREKEPDLQGEIRLLDVETAEIRRIWMTKRELARYAKAFQQFMDDLHRFCMRRQIDYFPWTTDQLFEDTFLDLLSRGSALAGTG
ncbi:MAG: DUF58 domain-containing protein [Pirellulales bacterium]|nr:DUF58 domain-containing protein [Pirellulales bacterium]